MRLLPGPDRGAVSARGRPVARRSGRGIDTAPPTATGMLVKHARRGTGLARREPRGAGSVAVPDRALAVDATAWDSGCTGGGFGTRKAGGPAWRPSKLTTSSMWSGKTPTCEGWITSSAAWCVRSVSSPHGRLFGEVSGSRPKPYAVVVKYESGAGTALVPVEGHCSCPVGRNCKHTAAVLLAARHVSPEAVDGAAVSCPQGCVP